MAEASEFDHDLALRGLSLWRFVNDLPLGGLSEPEIRRGIAESDAFVLYVTPRVFSSDVIWRVEVPAAIARAKRAARRGRHYPIVPVLRGVTRGALAKHCASNGITDLPMRNLGHVPLRQGDRATYAARRSGYQDIARRLLRALVPELATTRTSITLRSFPAPEAAKSVLDINWSGSIDGAPARIWESDLRPALRDLKAELARAHRSQLDLFVKTRLGAALGAGMEFPLASGFDIVVRDRQGRWSSRRHTWPLRRDDLGPGFGSRAVLEISLAQDAAAGAAMLRRRLLARHIRLTPPGGASRTYDPRSHASAIARQVGDIARELRSAGVCELHIVVSAPAALAFLIGRELHAVGRVHSHYRDQGGHLMSGYIHRA